MIRQEHGMDEHTQSGLLKLQFAELTDRTPFCPEDQEIAEYFDGAATVVERIKLENHLTDCRFCLARIGMLQRLQADPVGKRVPEEGLAAAKLMGHGQVRRRKLAPAWAAAAVVVIAVGVYSQLATFVPVGREVLPRMHESEPSGAPRETRTIDPTALGPRFLSPEEGMAVSSGDGVFRWTAVPNCLYYQLRIVSDEGDLLWQVRVDGTEWKLPSGLALSPGAEYYVRVDAFMSEAKYLQSDYLLFRFEDRG